MQSACFLCFWGRFSVKNGKKPPPHTKRAPLKRLNLRNWKKNHSEFWRRPFFFFGDHLILGGKNLRISHFGRKITLNFGEDLFFFFGDHLILGGKNLWISELSETFRLNFRTNRLKLIQDRWKFESRSFAHFSLFQNSPPLFQILATRLSIVYSQKNFKSNSKFCYIICITPKRVTNWRGPSPRHCAQAAQLLSKKCCSGGKPFATLCSIWIGRVWTWWLQLQRRTCYRSTI